MGPVDIPLYVVAAGLVLLGVTVLVLGHRQVIHTGPVVTVVPSTDADESRVTNLVSSAHAIYNTRARASAPLTPTR